MVTNKNQYYIKGVDFQKRPDIVIEVKRCSLSVIKDLSEIDKQKIKIWLEQRRTELTQLISLI